MVGCVWSGGREKRVSLGDQKHKGEGRSVGSGSFGKVDATERVTSPKTVSEMKGKAHSGYQSRKERFQS